MVWDWKSQNAVYFPLLLQKCVFNILLFHLKSGTRLESIGRFLLPCYHTLYHTIPKTFSNIITVVQSQSTYFTQWEIVMHALCEGGLGLILSTTWALPGVKLEDWDKNKPKTPPKMTQKQK